MVGVGGSGKELTQNLLGTGNGVGKGFHQLSGCLARYVNHSGGWQEEGRGRRLLGTSHHVF